MTPVILMKKLAEFIQEKTEDMRLQVRTKNGGEEGKERAAEVHLMRLPKKEDQTQRIPYILIQFLSGKDDKQEREPEESTCRIRIVVGTYSEDGGVGAMDVLNVILRIKNELEKTVIIGGMFVLQKPLEYIVYPDSVAPYYFGEMILNWSLPTTERKVM